MQRSEAAYDNLSIVFGVALEDVRDCDVQLSWNRVHRAFELCVTSTVKSESMHLRLAIPDAVLTDQELARACGKELACEINRQFESMRKRLCFSHKWTNEGE